MGLVNYQPSRAPLGPIRLLQLTYQLLASSVQPSTSETVLHDDFARADWRDYLRGAARGAISIVSSRRVASRMAAVAYYHTSNPYSTLLLTAV